MSRYVDPSGAGRPCCMNCGAVVDVGYWICPSCKRPYGPKLLEEAMEHSANRDFVKAMKQEHRDG